MQIEDRDADAPTIGTAPSARNREEPLECSECLATQAAFATAAVFGQRCEPLVRTERLRKLQQAVDSVLVVRMHGSPFGGASVPGAEASSGASDGWWSMLPHRGCRAG